MIILIWTVFHKDTNCLHVAHIRQLELSHGRALTIILSIVVCCFTIFGLEVEAPPLILSEVNTGDLIVD